MIASGPNGSSFMTRASCGTSVSTVGSKKLPLLPMRLPPVRSVRALLHRVADEALHRGDAARIGQRAHLVPFSRPSPTFTALASAMNLSTNSS